jgi:hypothetical protein
VPREFEIEETPEPEKTRLRPAPGAFPRRPSERRGAAARPARGKWGVFLLLNLIPIGAVVAWFAMPEETKKRFAEKIPPGIGTRAAVAGGVLAAMFVLARLVLPGARAALQGLARAGGWFKSQTGAKRVALFPGEAVVDLSWVLVQCLFAIDVILILACGAAFLLYVVRIVKPETFPWLPF